jgi:hypothetical protein
MRKHDLHSDIVLDKTSLIASVLYPTSPFKIKMTWLCLIRCSFAGARDQGRRHGRTSARKGLHYEGNSMMDTLQFSSVNSTVNSSRSALVRHRTTMDFKDCPFLAIQVIMEAWKCNGELSAQIYFFHLSIRLDLNSWVSRS